MNQNALNLGFVGAGECGTRLVSAFSRKNPSVCVVNTSPTDNHPTLVKDSQSLLIRCGIQGAGRDIKLGEQLFQNMRGVIQDFLHAQMSGKVDYVFIVVGLGGGTGTGFIKIGIEIIREIGIPMGVIATLPKGSEDYLTQRNAYEGLTILHDFVQKKSIAPVILIDNENITRLYPNISVFQQWQGPNDHVTKMIDMVNHLPTRKSLYYSALDPMDFTRIMTIPGYMTLGRTEIKDYTFQDSVIEGIQTGVENGLFCSAFDLSHAQAAGVIFVGPKSVFKKMSVQRIEMAMNSLSIRGPVFSGIYTHEGMLDRLMVYLTFSGLKIPQMRFEEIRTLASVNRRSDTTEMGDTDKMVKLENEREKTSPVLNDFIKTRLTRKF